MLWAKESSNYDSSIDVCCASFALKYKRPNRHSLAVTTVVAMVIKQGTDFLIDTAIVMYVGATNFPLIAIPLFILAGAIMNTSGISRRLIAFASALVGFYQRWIKYD